MNEQTWLQRIQINPQIMTGKPVIQGTHIPVELVVRLLAQGVEEEEILQEYPRLELADIRAALMYAAQTGSSLGVGSGTVYTTNRRVWEHDEEFKSYLRKIRAMAVDMETATLFVAGFTNEIPTGALLLVSDQPMIAEGVKTDKSDNSVTQNYIKQHIEIGIRSLQEIKNNGTSVKHLRYSYSAD